MLLTNTKRPPISIIIPVYNASAYLTRCIESVLQQTYTALEILLIDDGSTDGSKDICSAYACQDARIRVLRQDNAGVSAARNAGIAVAQGAYIAFVDSDDSIEPTLIEDLYETLKKHGAQISVSGILFVDAAGRALRPYPKAVACTLNAEQALAGMFYQTLFLTSPCAKLFETELVRAHPFPEGERYEDLATVYRWVAEADTVAVDTKPLYRYLQHADSFMGQTFTEARFAELDTVDELFAFTQARFPEILAAARARRFAAYCQVLLGMPTDRRQYPDKRARILQTMHTDMLSVRKDPRCRTKDRLAAWLMTVAGESGLRLIWKFCG